MILAVHLLTGATIISLFAKLAPEFLWLGFVLAFLSHYALDALPHWDYSIENIKQGKWKKTLPEFAKIFFDVGSILTLVFVASQNYYLLLGAIAGGLPDILFFLNCLWPNKILSFLDAKIHDKTHFPENKMRPSWRAAITFLVLILILYCFLRITANSPLTGSFWIFSKTSVIVPR